MATFPSLSYVCPIRWSEMRGDEKERFCSKCSRSIVNVSLLTEAERLSLLNRTSSDQLCIAYYRRLSGEFVSAENPLQPSERRSLVQFGATALSIGALAAAVNTIPADALKTARQEILSSSHYLHAQVESNVSELLEKISAPFAPKQDPSAMLFLGVMAGPPSTITISCDLAPATTSPAGSAHAE